jgi:predicted porin
MEVDLWEIPHLSSFLYFWSLFMMKKTLVALAVTAATGAFAQVTITGFVDRGYLNNDNSDAKKDATTIGSNTGTTGMVFTINEDLGGGLSGRLVLGADFSDMGGATQDNTTWNASALATMPIQGSGFMNSQSFLELASKTMGAVRLGNINNEFFTANSTIASSMGTGVGGSYTSAFSGYDGYGTGTTSFVGLVGATTRGATAAGVRGVRQSNTIKYVSPSFNGITFAYGYAPKVEAGGSADTVGATDYSIRYTQGALDVMYAAIKYEVGNSAPTYGGLTANTDNTHTVIAASFQVTPAFKVNMSTGSSKSNTDSIANSDTYGLGATFKATSNIDLMVQAAKHNDKNATGYSRGMYGIGANYHFTKLTRAYFRYDNLSFNVGGTTTSGDQLTRTAVGIAKNF